MAVDWRHLIFGDVDSADYGIYISGDGVYNAPERDVEFVSVPGRNGDIAMDQGRYNNITVTYPAGTFAKTQEEFREKLSAFRNAVLSQKGYQRLEDTYHPEEFRMAVYTAGLEVDPVAYQQAGEFELTFNCKPQRWLSVGALPIPVDSGDVLQNPTVFDSSPLLEVEGYGTVSFNGYQFTLNDVTMGNIQLDRSYNSGLRRSANYTNNITYTVKLDTTNYNVGDTIRVGASRHYLKIYGTYPYQYLRTDATSGNVTPSSVSATAVNWNPIIAINLPAISFTAGTASDQYYSTKMVAVIPGSGDPLTIYMTAGIKHIVTATGHYIETRIVASLYYTASGNPAGHDIWTSMEYYVARGGITVDSSVPALGNPTYVDCETGDVYKVEGDNIVAVRNAATLGSDLPVLGPGSNKITFDNTVTDLKIAPRWWKV